MKIILILLLGIGPQLMAQDIGGDYYLAPTGSDANPGTYAEPWATWQYAATNADQPGDTVYVRGGAWNVTGTSAVATFTHSGTFQNPICFFNYPGEIPIIDGSSRWNQDWNTGLNFTTINYFHIRGIEIRNFYQPRTGAQQAVAMGGSDCTNMTFENMKIHDIGGSAIRWFGAFKYPASGFTYPDDGFDSATYINAGLDYGYLLPGHDVMGGDTTRFINCDSYNCVDSLSTPIGAGGSADGFKCDNEINSYFEFRGCRAWNCSDDGFDISGSVRVLMENCWSIGNGLLAVGDGSGFKHAYPRQYINTPIRIMKNCIGANNRDVAVPVIVEVDYPCMSVKMVNNLYYNNDRGIVSRFGSNQCLNPQLRTYRNNLTYASKEIYGYEMFAFLPSPNDPTHDHNSWDASPSVTLSDADFVSLDASQLDNPRKSDGSLPDITFGRLDASSDLMGAGTYVGMSATPDIGIDWAYLDAQSEIDSTLTDILTFTIPEQTGVSVINTTTHTVTASVVYGTSLTTLVPTITLDYGATVSPTSGTATNFTSPVVYTVTALDAVTEQEWTVTVTVAGEGIVAPTITTTAVIAHSIQAVTGGNVTSAGGGTVSAKGICYGTSINPTVTGTHTHNGTGTGAFSHRLDNLSPSTTYHVRAYATNEAGTNYGLNYQFTTSAFSSGRSGGKTLKYNGKTVIIK